MTVPDELPALDSLRPLPLADNPCLRGMLAEKPIWRVRTQTGDEAWLVLGHSEVRQLLCDNRLGRSHASPSEAPRLAENPMFDMIASSAAGGGDPQQLHTEMRALLVPYFTHKRMSALRPRVETIVNEAIDHMLDGTPPADLYEAIALPVPWLVLGELVGIPVQERDQLAALMDNMHVTGEDSSFDDRTDALAYLTELVTHRREHPGEDLISAICQKLDVQTIARIVCMLVFAGHESVSTHVVTGMVRLMTRQDLRDAVTADPDVMGTAVEELLRTANVGGGWHPHYALEDIEISGVSIRAGDLVLPDFSMASHDPRSFDDPLRIDLRRTPNPHLAFAHGQWHCIGTPLAKLQLRVIFSALLTRIPRLRLAVPLNELLDLDVNRPRLSRTFDKVLVTW